MNITVNIKLNQDKTNVGVDADINISKHKKGPHSKEIIQTERDIIIHDHKNHTKIKLPPAPISAAEIN